MLSSPRRQKIWLLIRACARVCRLLGHILGVYLLSLIYSLLPAYRDPAKRIAFARHHYFRTAVIACGARLHVDTDAATLEETTHALYVSNHVSWMDILILYRVLPIRFISKIEVDSWPFFGHFARWAGTIFLERGKSGLKVLDSATTALARASLVLFAEGTSTDGHQVRRFLPPLFRSAIAADAPVVPVTVHYVYRGYNPTGLGSSYFGDDSLISSAWRAVCLDRVDVFVKIHRPISSADASAADLASRAHSAVADGLAQLRLRGEDGDGAS